MGFIARAKAWIRRALGADRVRVVRRYPLPRVRKGTSDDVRVWLDHLAISVRRDIHLEIPFEVTVVVPRAEVTRRYQDGKLSEEVLVYSSITVSHAPRPPETGRSDSHQLRPSGHPG